MPVQLSDFEPLLTRDGPITVTDKDGGLVTQAPSGAAHAVDPDIAQVLTLQEIQIVLYDVTSRPVRSIRGDQIEAVRRSSPGWEIVVDDTVKPDEGPTTPTRGAYDQPTANS